MSKTLTKVGGVYVYPHPILSKPCEDIDVYNEDELPEIQELIKQMSSVVKTRGGVGLSANQIGVSKRVFIIKVKEEDSECFINPELEIPQEAKPIVSKEGCLSIPGITAQVQRVDSIIVRALDSDGSPFQKTLYGLKAIIAQHENDHLNGVTLMGLVSRTKRMMLTNKLNRLKRQYLRRETKTI